MKNYSILFATALLLLFCQSCQIDIKSEDDKTSIEIEKNDEKIEKVKNEIEDIFEKIESKSKDIDLKIGDKKGKNVSHNELQEVFPSSIWKYSRSEFDGETAGALGFNISQTEAEYSKRGGGKIDLSVLDVAGFGSSILSLIDFADIKLDKDSRNATEKTTEHRGHTAFIDYDKKDKSGQYIVIVEDRFIVIGDGKEVSLTEIKDLVHKVDFKELEKWAD